ncbi:hypothetical protein SLY17_000843 [Cronobacter dublinensis]|nr:hypothetical protein [Cronobacter dublinensis]
MGLTAGALCLPALHVSKIM